MPSEALSFATIYDHISRILSLFLTRSPPRPTLGEGWVVNCSKSKSFSIARKQFEGDNNVRTKDGVTVVRVCAPSI